MSTELSLQTQLNQLEYDEKLFELFQRKGKMLAQSKMVPDILRDNIADCTQLVEIAHSLNVNPFMLSRFIYFVHGKPGFEAKFAIAQLNRSGILRGRLQFKHTGQIGTDSQGKIAWGVLAKTGETIEGPEITIAMAKRDGWYDKNGSKWKTLPDLMLTYRAASFFINSYALEVMAGIPMFEDIEDGDIRDIDAEVIRRPRAQTNDTITKAMSGDQKADESVPHSSPEETSGAGLTPDGVLYDSETGEVIEKNKETTASRQEQFEAMDSPAFQTLMKKLEDCQDTKGVNELRRLPLYNRCTPAEREKFKRAAAMKFQTPTNA